MTPTAPLPDVDPAMLSRAQGCLLGRVASDALGSLVKFQTPQEIREAHPQGVRELASGGDPPAQVHRAEAQARHAPYLARCALRRPRNLYAAIGQGVSQHLYLLFRDVIGLKPPRVPRFVRLCKGLRSITASHRCNISRLKSLSPWSASSPCVQAAGLGISGQLRP